MFGCALKRHKPAIRCIAAFDKHNLSSTPSAFSLIVILGLDPKI